MYYISRQVSKTEESLHLLLLKGRNYGFLLLYAFVLLKGFPDTNILEQVLGTSG
jgi:hypothetical protein